MEFLAGSFCEREDATRSPNNLRLFRSLLWKSYRRTFFDFIVTITSVDSVSGNLGKVLSCRHKKVFLPDFCTLPKSGRKTLLWRSLEGALSLSPSDAFLRIFGNPHKMLWEISPWLLRGSMPFGGLSEGFPAAGLRSRCR